MVCKYFLLFHILQKLFPSWVFLTALSNMTQLCPPASKHQPHLPHRPCTRLQGALAPPSSRSTPSPIPSGLRDQPQGDPAPLISRPAAAPCPLTRWHSPLHRKPTPPSSGTEVTTWGMTLPPIRPGASLISQSTHCNQLQHNRRETHPTLMATPECTALVTRGEGFWAPKHTSSIRPLLQDWET